MSLSNISQSPNSILSPNTPSDHKSSKLLDTSSAISTYGSRRNKKNLVLSTSFVSARTLDASLQSPISPLQSKKSRNAVPRILQSLRTELVQLEQELLETRKKKHDVEKTRDASEPNIYTGAYSTEHLHRHSMRIKTNAQVRELEKNIKKLEKKIDSLKVQYEDSKRYYLNEVRDSELTNRDSVGTLSTTEVSSTDGEMMKLPSNEAEDIVMDDAGSVVHADIDADDLVEDFDFENDPGLIAGIDTSTVDGKEVPSFYGGTPRAQSIMDRPRSNNSAALESVTWKITDYMQILQDSSLSTDLLLEKANGFVELLKISPEIRPKLLLTSFLYSIQSLLLREDKMISAAAYRICKYLIDGPEFVKRLINLRLDIFIIMSLVKDNSYQIEREQALKLLRAFGSYKHCLTVGLVQAVISCVERPEDPLRNVAIETLLEFCFTHPHIVSKCRGMRVIEDLLKSYSSFPLASITLDTVLQLMNSHRTRKYFLNDFTISVLFTAFSDTDTNSSIDIEELRDSAALICRAFKNYNGIMLFCVDNFKPIKELLAFFQIPICAQYLIEIFLDILRIKNMSPKPSARFASANQQNPSHFLEESSIFNQQLALIISILDKGNFQKHLADLINRVDDKKFSAKTISNARYLLAEYLSMRSNLINDGSIPSFQSLEGEQQNLFEQTFAFDKMMWKMNKSRATLGMDHVEYTANTKQYAKIMKENIFVHDVDDLKFRRMVYDSKVLQTKDFQYWNWNIILELLEGPLMNKTQLEELVRSTKFIRRLLVFYRPLRMRFSNVNQGSRLSQKYIQVGCAFFKMLTINPEGIKILTEDTKIVPQLASLLFKAMDEDGSPNIFSEVSLRSKVLPGYFKFIGVLTRSVAGIKVLMRWNFFTVIYKMFKVDSRICLKFLLLTLPELDLRHSTHCRTIIGMALVAPIEEVRILATKCLGEGLKSLLTSEDMCEDSNCDEYRVQRFEIEMLTRQLYDLSPKVVAVADQALYECILGCKKSKELSLSLRTFLNQMVFIRSPILFEMLGHPYGFQLLNDINFVQEERMSWLKSKNKEYVSIIEAHLRQGTYSPNRLAAGRYETDRIPLHFYGCLARIENGITLISQNGDLVQFMNSIKNYIDGAMKTEDAEEILETKAGLWCCGYIGSTELGIGLLDNFSLVEDIVEIALHARDTNIKFTALYTLGLISRTKEGCEILDEMGWYCSVSAQWEPTGITLPKQLDVFLSFNESDLLKYQEHGEELIEFDYETNDLTEKLPPVKFDLEHWLLKDNTMENGAIDDNIGPSTTDSRHPIGSGTTAVDPFVKRDYDYSASDWGRSLIVLGEETNDAFNEVVNAVSQLNNHILSNVAIKNVTELNKKYGPHLFESEIMMFKVLKMMDKFRYKPHVRKFLCKLFINSRALENVIRHDRKLRDMEKGLIGNPNGSL